MYSYHITANVKVDLKYETVNHQHCASLEKKCGGKRNKNHCTCPLAKSPSSSGNIGAGVDIEEIPKFDRLYFNQTKTSFTMASIKNQVVSEQ